MYGIRMIIRNSLKILKKIVHNLNKKVICYIAYTAFNSNINICIVKYNARCISTKFQGDLKYSHLIQLHFIKYSHLIHFHFIKIQKWQKLYIFFETSSKIFFVGLCIIWINLFHFWAQTIAQNNTIINSALSKSTI